ncbi:MAG TPA: YceI family protein, partial [Promineifilum sp.]|nr:YceI family protein [Promineifilum sp.]
MAWQIDKSHTHVTFVARHMMVAKVRGEFSNYEVEVAYNEDTPSLSSVKAVIYTDSINTRDERRDGHLRSADFVDAANYPTMTFESKRVEQRPNGNGRITGDLTIRGVAREVVLDV